MLHATGTPLDHRDGTIEVEVEVVDLRGSGEPIGVDMQQVDAAVGPGMSPSDDEGGAGDRTAHAEAFAESPRERRLPSAEVAREHDEVTRAQVSRHGTTPRLRGLAVGQLDVTLWH